jgi:tetratricopeptide (TPR) repeat protein
MRSVLVGLAVVLVMYGCASFEDMAPQGDPEGASAQPDQDPVLDPTEEAYERINLAVSLGNPEEAIAAYEAAQLEDPNSPETQVLLANLYLAAGDPTAAAEILDSVLADNPTNSDALFSQALIAGTRGDTDREQELLERAVAADPQHSGARAALGEIYLENRRYNDAEEAFESSLSADENNIVALIGLGNVKLRTEEPEQADAVLTRAIEVAPDYSFAYADRSRAKAMQYELDAAEDDLSQAIEIDTDFPWHYYDRGLVRLEQNDYDGAVEDFDTFLKDEAEIFLGYVHRARAYIGLDQRDAAIVDFRRALDLRPDYVPGYRPYAMILFESERYQQAAEYFGRAWSETHPNDPKDHGLVILAALSWKFAGERAQAEAFIENAASELPQDSLYYEMARYYMRSPQARRGLDSRILGAIEDEQDRALRLRMKFFLAGQYEVDGRRNSAIALYREVKETNLLGIPEIRLAEARYDALSTP